MKCHRDDKILTETPPVSTLTFSRLSGLTLGQTSCQTSLPLSCCAVSLNQHSLGLKKLNIDMKIWGEKSIWSVLQVVSVLTVLTCSVSSSPGWSSISIWHRVRGVEDWSPGVTQAETAQAHSYLSESIFIWWCEVYRYSYAGRHFTRSVQAVVTRSQDRPDITQFLPPPTMIRLSDLLGKLRLIISQWQRHN